MSRQQKVNVCTNGCGTTVNNSQSSVEPAYARAEQNNPVTQLEGFKKFAAEHGAKVERDASGRTTLKFSAQYSYSCGNGRRSLEGRELAPKNSSVPYNFRWDRSYFVRKIDA